MQYFWDSFQLLQTPAAIKVTVLYVTLLLKSLCSKINIQPDLTKTISHNMPKIKTNTLLSCGDCVLSHLLHDKPKADIHVELNHKLKEEKFYNYTNLSAIQTLSTCWISNAKESVPLNNSLPNRISLSVLHCSRVGTIFGSSSAIRIWS